MAKPSTRQGLIDYGLRKLGAPVLEINIADEQIEDCLDDTIIFYQDRHMDGVEKMYLKHKITKDFTDTIQATSAPGRETSLGITTTTSPSVNFTGIGGSTFSFEESQIFIQIPDAVIGISHEEVITSGETQVHITWTNPQQKCAACIALARIVLLV